MKILLLLLLTVQLSAQVIPATPKVIYKANKVDTVTFAASPSGSCSLTLKVDNEAIDDNVQLVGYHVKQLYLDSGVTVTAYGTGTIGYTIYKNGVNVTPVSVADNSETDMVNLINSLTAAQQRKVIALVLRKSGISIKDIKQAVK